ncbi:MAG: tRNA (adenosine(37)-N6)-threonylcarbamoyltransferase complex dimerization subunit type 1 TsaB [Hyphomicrobiaceae bacterium]|nr:MAG: tRNA (adenosine(37)-N6)-threonylcarbamoyltransferase complex dimerization subunit type 1 TsaB [Hyphomicrobiaceae bacterium]
MRILAFDTCFGACSAAVRWQGAGGEWLLREAYEAREHGHAEVLLPMIEEVMQGAGLEYKEIDRIAVTFGPGLFTGVRTGVAAARAFAVALERPVVGLSSLAVMAHRADLLLGKERAERELVVAVDARRDSLFVQRFEGPERRALSEPQLLEIGEAAGLLDGREALAVGSGAELLQDAMRGRDGVVSAALPQLEPHARSLAMLAPALHPLDPVRPLYLRAPDAKPGVDQPIARKH